MDKAIPIKPPRVFSPMERREAMLREMDDVGYLPDSESDRVENGAYYIHAKSYKGPSPNLDRVTFVTWKPNKDGTGGKVIDLCIHRRFKGTCKDCDDIPEVVVVCKSGKKPEEICTECLNIPEHEKYSIASDIPKSEKDFKENVLYRYARTVVMFNSSVGYFLCVDHIRRVDKCDECCCIHACFHENVGVTLQKGSCSTCLKAPVHKYFLNAVPLPKTKSNRLEFVLYRYRTTVVYYEARTGYLRCKDHDLTSSCVKCFGGKKCQHGFWQYYCDECAIDACVHKKPACLCEKCGEKYTCIHGKKRSMCRECIPYQEQDVSNVETTMELWNDRIRKHKDGRVYLHNFTKVTWDPTHNVLVCFKHKKEYEGCSDCKDMPVNKLYTTRPPLPRKLNDRIFNVRHTVYPYRSKGTLVYQKSRDSFITCVAHHIRIDQCRICRGGPTCEHKKPMYFCRRCAFEECGHYSSRREIIKGKQKAIQTKHKRYECPTGTPLDGLCNVQRKCEHDILRSKCTRDDGLCRKTCNGRYFKCKHGTSRSACIIDNGTCREPRIVGDKCKHGVYQMICIACGGSTVCSHSKNRVECEDCGKICEHGKMTSYCKECSEWEVCEHDDNGTVGIPECWTCSKCEHNRLILDCVICSNESSVEIE